MPRGRWRIWVSNLSNPPRVGPWYVQDSAPPQGHVQGPFLSRKSAEKAAKKMRALNR